MRVSLHPTQPIKSWEYAVRVSNANYELEPIVQLYRDRAHCVDLVYNWWSW